MMSTKLILLTSFVLVVGLVGNASARLPGGCSSRDIGSPGAAGSADYDRITGTWIVTGDGLDIRKKK